MKLQIIAETLPWQPSVRLSVKMAMKFLNAVNEDVRAQNDTLENPNTREHQEGL